MSSIRLAIIEDDRRYRDGLVMLFEGTPGFEVVGSFGAMEEALLRALPQPPDVLLCDIHLPGMSGVEGLGRLREKWPEAIAVMLTVFEQDQWLLEALASGAVGYLLKRTPPARLLEAVREAREGGSPMSPEIARKLVALFHQGRVAAAPRQESSLSEREVRLLALLAEGHSYQAAAAALGVSINTVRKHIRSIYEQLQVHTKSAAVSRALKAGLI
ncbi:MAG TPA: response regulator transcription factor [Thermoanaerobaculia bacterium]|nr:response regulator transcription factor [Thermoanaerobaculia bacterium]